MTHYFLGIDASKGYCDFVMLNANKQTVIENFQLDDTFEGHSRLYELLRRFNQDHPQSSIYAAVESTGVDMKTTGFNRCSHFRAAYQSKPLTSTRWGSATTPKPISNAMSPIRSVPGMWPNL